ncbi:MAG: hypothetical protein Kow00127_02460 [Bacteroidales bacterium]
MLLTPEGNCLLSGSADSVPAHSYLWMRAIGGVHGDSLWQTGTEMEEPVTGYQLTQDITGDGYWLSGSLDSAAQMFHFDNSGVLSGNFGSNDTVTWYAGHVQVPGGNIVAIQSLQQDEETVVSRLIRFGQDGSVIWQNDYESDPMSGIILTPGQEIRVSATYYNPTYPHPKVVGYGLAGNQLFTNMVNEVNGYNLGLTTDSNHLILLNRRKYIISGHVGNITLTEENGDYIWSEDLDSPGSSWVRDAVVYGDFILAGSERYGTQKQKIVISVITTDGMLINGHTEEMIYPKVISMAIRDNSLYVAGTRVVDTLGHMGVFLTALNADSLLVTTVGVDAPEWKPEFLTYPNPVTDRLRINPGLSNAESWKVQVFNSKGEVVLYQAGFGQLPEVDCSALTPGVYFIRYLGSTAGIRSAKILKK